MNKNNFNTQESYEYYLKTKSINVTQKHFKVRKERLIQSWKQEGLIYPVKRTYTIGHSIKRKPKYNISLKTNYFTEVYTSTKAYYLGLIAADGNVLVRKDPKRGNRYDFRLGLKESDQDILNQFSLDIGHSLGLKTIPSKIITVNGPKEYVSERVKVLSIHNKEFVESIVSFGIIPNKSQLGIDTSKIPRQYIKDFIRGYFDGDGCIGVYFNKEKINAICYICSNTEEILQFIKSFLPAEIHCYISKNKKMYYLRIRRNSILNFYNFIKNESLCLTRKKLKFEKLRTYVERSTYANSVNSGKGEIPNPEPNAIEIL